MNLTSKHIKALTGKKFGWLTVLQFKGTNKWSRALWLCLCVCGNKIIVSGSSLIQKDTMSCGCYCRSSEPHIRHGYAYHPLYTVWSSMCSRCNNKKSAGFKNYGGRGISVCDVWRSDAKAFIEWGLSNGWEQGLQLDRKDNDGNYTPENCRFVTCRVNILNRRSAPNIGVRKDKRCQSFCSRVYYKGRYVFSKNFKTFNKAATARNTFILENNLPHALTKLKRRNNNG